LPWRRRYSINRRLLSPVNGIKFKEETANVLHLKHSFLVLKREHFRKQIKKPETCSNVVLKEDGLRHLE